MVDLHQGLPVHGYKPQTPENVDLVNANKLVEEGIMRTLDQLWERDGIDKRWLAIGRTHIETGFMAVNRAILQPKRID